MNIDLTALFVCVDDFCKLYQKALPQNVLPTSRQRKRNGYLSLSEMLFIQIFFHFSPYKDFKDYYVYGVSCEHRDKFAKLPCYERFVQLKKGLFMPLVLLLHCFRGQATGIYFADSTAIKVCHNHRINQHKLFKDLAQRAKSTMGWFFGFKLHLIINDKGQIMAVKISPGNTDDRRVLKTMVKGLVGKCYVDKGYISKELVKQLCKQGLLLITGIRRNMKNYLQSFWDKWMLRKRFLIETVFGQLKTQMAFEHTRHRSIENAFVHLLSTLVAYCYSNNKPAIKQLHRIS